MGNAGRGRIFTGIGGWAFEPWDESFYPEKLPKKRQLEYASGKLTSIEINSTYYGPQKPQTFARWRDETPEGFVFSLKAPRFSTNRRVLAEAGEGIERFINGGLLELGDKLGVINWQFMATKKFDPDDFGAFLKLLPKSVEGRVLRHAVEVRHESFGSPDFIALLREHGVAVVIACDSKFPQFSDLTAPFAYLRIMGTKENEPLGYSEAELDQWAECAQAIAAGDVPHGAKSITPPVSDNVARDVYLYVISGYKAHNPAAAMALIDRLK
ncbi:DUF72 domain-containing protein [Falsochrobactrum shanghaiense]|uniref:DUF72 domain-containing protein n=1 Tax=Falsochrobactrum shanghaiense TaxID=2201899 RepID=A0A316J5G4_9HYPH|nr:DUF72 domain-containing protein [Falsochrobactrum shanghaiense]PWL17172.1 DUF72 domain-containing protein [Falsochrobactrum shanghaiense]